jgi:D-3-phosphoglycerate dehydrogenase / 2-oxoglutarate reductase
MARILNGGIEKALVLENPSDLLDSLLRKEGFTVRRLSKTPAEDELIKEVNDFGAQAIFKRSKVAVTRKVIEACPSLLVIQLCCIGDDSVDKVACAEHGIMVFNDPISNGRSVVELVIGNLITLSRRLFETNSE